MLITFVVDKLYKMLNQDYDRQHVDPDLDTNCLVVGTHERMFEKDKVRVRLIGHWRIFL